MAKTNGKTDEKKVSLSDRIGRPTHLNEKGELTAEGKKVVAALFKNYDAANIKLEKARIELESAMAERSNAVEAIARAGGPGFKRGGKDLKVMAREAPDTGVTTWFFRGEREFRAPEV